MSFSLVLFGVLFLAAGSIAGLAFSLVHFPTWEFKRVLREFRDEGFDFGSFKHFKDYADHTLRIVPKPNCETLYSGAFIRKQDGPCVLSMPPFDAYFSFVFISSKTDVMGYFTNRDVKPDEEGRILVYFDDRDRHRPEYKDITASIKIDTDMCWIIGRFGIDGPDQLGHVNRVQDAIRIIYGY